MAILKKISDVSYDQNKSENIFSFAKINRLVIHLTDRIRVISIEMIEFVQAEGNYSSIHLIDGSKILTSKTLKSITESLNDDFVRIHKSYMINLNYVSQYNIKDAQIIMDSSKITQVSRANRAMVKQLFR